MFRKYIDTGNVDFSLSLNGESILLDKNSTYLYTEDEYGNKQVTKVYRTDLDRLKNNSSGYCKQHPEMEEPWPCDICKEKED